MPRPKQSDEKIRAGILAAWRKLDEERPGPLCSGSGSIPIVAEEQEFLGPAALAKARRFYDDPRDVRHDGLIEMLDSEDGIQGCQLVYNCVKVCPRDVAPGGAIRKMKGDAERLPDISDGGV